MKVSQAKVVARREIEEVREMMKTKEKELVRLETDLGECRVSVGCCCCYFPSYGLVRTVSSSFRYVKTHGFLHVGALLPKHLGVGTSCSRNPKVRRRHSKT
jgi:hypothetical protein